MASLFFVILSIPLEQGVLVRDQSNGMYRIGMRLAAFN